MNIQWSVIPLFQMCKFPIFSAKIVVVPKIDPKSRFRKVEIIWIRWSSSVRLQSWWSLWAFLNPIFERKISNFKQKPGINKQWVSIIPLVLQCILHATKATSLSMPMHMNTIGMTSEYKWKNARLWRKNCLSQTCVGDQYHLRANFIYDSHKLIDPIIYFTAKLFIIFLLNFQFQAFHSCEMRQLFTEAPTDCIYIDRCWYGEQR